MGETSIEWTQRVRNGWTIPGFTHNEWIGCEKVSPGCKNCYASVDTYARVSKSRGLPLWGPNSTRHRTTRANRRKPYRWAKKARQASEILGFEVRPAVFAQSLSDTFEDRRDLDPWRRELFALIEATPELDWILVTKRPEKVLEMVPQLWRGHPAFAASVCAGKTVYDGSTWPSNVIVLTSVENQEEADRRIPHLLRIPGRRGLSIEPLLGPVDLADVKLGDGLGCNPLLVDDTFLGVRYQKLDWVIVGGESGTNARPMHPDWVRSIRDQCAAAGVPYFFKQWGEWVAILDRDNDDPDWRYDYSITERDQEHYRTINLAGGQGFHGERLHVMRKVGKKNAGRTLDGRTWDKVPK
jgi:protein gp37